jgi:hypothetical protein
MPTKSEAGRRTVGLTLSPEDKTELDAIARRSGHTPTTLAKILYEYGLGRLKALGSVEALRAELPARRRSARARVSAETIEATYTALDTILEEAPSAVIHRLVTEITRLGGKFGGQR